MTYHSDIVYIPSNATDIVATWRKYGYVPPSELPEYQAKWQYYQELPLRKETPHLAGQIGGTHLKETMHYTSEMT